MPDSKRSVRIGCLLKYFGGERHTLLKILPQRPGYGRTIETKRHIDGQVSEQWLRDFVHARACSCQTNATDERGN